MTPEAEERLIRKMFEVKTAVPRTLPAGAELRAWDEGRLRGWVLGQGPSILLAHGWAGRSGQLAPLAEGLVAAGFRAVAFDMPAHGDSPGREASVVVFAQAIAAVAKAEGPLAGAVGHSLGGAALALAVGWGLELPRVVLVAAPQSPQGFVEAVGRSAGLEGEALGAFIQRVELHVGWPLARLDAAQALKDTQARVTVFHSADDREVPISAGRAVCEGARGRFVELQGQGHTRLLADPAVLAQIRDALVGGP